MPVYRQFSCKSDVNQNKPENCSDCKKNSDSQKLNAALSRARSNSRKYQRASQFKLLENPNSWTEAKDETEKTVSKKSILKKSNNNTDGAPLAAINSFDTSPETPTELSTDTLTCELYGDKQLPKFYTRKRQNSTKNARADSSLISEASIHYDRDGPSLAGYGNVFATAVNTVQNLKPLPILKANIFNKGSNIATAKYQKIQDEYYKLVKRAILLVLVGISIVIVGCVATYYYFKYRAICCSTIIQAVGGHLVEDNEASKPGRTSHDPTPCRISCTEEDIHKDKKMSKHGMAHLFLIVGPITLALGIMTSICGCVWFPVIKEKYTKMMNN